MPNRDGTGPAGAGTRSGFGRAQRQRRGRNSGDAGVAGYGRQRRHCRRLSGMVGFGGHWLGGSMEAIERHITRLQQYLAALKSQPASGGRDG